jgi:hypothetical protein
MVIGSLPRLEQQAVECPARRHRRVRQGERDGQQNESFAEHHRQHVAPAPRAPPHSDLRVRSATLCAMTPYVPSAARMSARRNRKHQRRELVGAVRTLHDLFDRLYVVEWKRTIHGRHRATHAVHDRRKWAA